MMRHTCRSESELQNGILTVRLTGEIDHHSAVHMRTALDEEICQKCPGKIVLDVSGIEFMDSSGLGFIMGRYSLMQKLGGTLSLKDPNERIEKILELANLKRLIAIEKSGREENR